MCMGKHGKHGFTYDIVVAGRVVADSSADSIAESDGGNNCVAIVGDLAVAGELACCERHPVSFLIISFHHCTIILCRKILSGGGLLVPGCNGNEADDVELHVGCEEN